MSIKVIICGGTIDKRYLSILETFKNVHCNSSIPAILRNGRCNDYYFPMGGIESKDSSDMHCGDRQKIYSLCFSAGTNKILITHGTDTIIETAKHLSTIKDKTIVLTGAFKPACLDDSDASFNVGGAIVALNLLPPGIFIVMNGEVFNWNEVKKNKETQRFERI